MDGSLRRLARVFGAADPDVLGSLFTRWNTAVGPQLAAHVRPVRLQGDVLTVEVDDPTWATQLRFLEKDLLARLAEDVGAPVAARIEVRVGGAGSRGRRRAR